MGWVCGRSGGSGRAKLGSAVSLPPWHEGLRQAHTEPFHAAVVAALALLPLAAHRCAVRTSAPACLAAGSARPWCGCGAPSGNKPPAPSRLMGVPAAASRGGDGMRECGRHARLYRACGHCAWMGCCCSSSRRHPSRRVAAGTPCWPLPALQAAAMCTYWRDLEEGELGLKVVH